MSTALSSSISAVFCTCKLVSEVGIWSLLSQDLLLQASCQSSLVPRLLYMISAAYEEKLCVVKSHGVEEKGRAGSRVGDILAFFEA